MASYFITNGEPKRFLIFVFFFFKERKRQINEPVMVEDDLVLPKDGGLDYQEADVAQRP